MQAATAQEVTLHGSTTVLNTIVAPHQAEIEQRSGQRISSSGTARSAGLPIL
jgi:hypothetical protein